MSLLTHVPFKNQERLERFRAFWAVGWALNVLSRGSKECSVVRKVHLRLWLLGSWLPLLRFCYRGALGPFSDTHVFWVALKKTSWRGVGKLTRKVRDWWQNPKCIFYILSESTTLYTSNVGPVLDRKRCVEFWTNRKPRRRNQGVTQGLKLKLQ